MVLKAIKSEGEQQINLNPSQSTEVSEFKWVWMLRNTVLSTSICRSFISFSGRVVFLSSVFFTQQSIKNVTHTHPSCMQSEVVQPLLSHSAAFPDHTCMAEGRNWYNHFTMLFLLCPSWLKNQYQFLYLHSTPP